MTYFDYISFFAGIDHPYGDLASDIAAERDSSEQLTPEEVEAIYEGNFSDIYDHLIKSGASKACMDTFIDSWAAYRKQEKEGFKDPVPFLIADQMKAINRNLEEICDQLRSHNELMDYISDSVYSAEGESAADIIDRLTCGIDDCIEHRKDVRGKEYALFRICGTVDTYEQN